VFHSVEFLDTFLCELMIAQLAGAIVVITCLEAGRVRCHAEYGTNNSLVHLLTMSRILEKKSHLPQYLIGFTVFFLDFIREPGKFASLVHLVASQAFY
jgi:hypothetical protein